MIHLPFSGSGIDRASTLRQQPEQLAAAFIEPTAWFVPIWQSRCLVRDGAMAVCRWTDVQRLVPSHEQAIFLGRRDGHALFAVEIRDAEPPAPLPAAGFLGLRDVAAEVGEADAALLAYARAMILWQSRHRHCGVCGAPNQPTDGGFAMTCTRQGCGEKCFPRIDPAVIVLVHHGRHCLLGRQAAWPAGRFSTIAGFVEPGEALEDAVVREVHEETNVRIGECQYLASQPWPFPAAMMLGFHAVAETTDIRFNDGELIEARWLTREDIAAGAVLLPPRVSIAYRLIEHWFDAGARQPLASLGLP
ncbi:MAG: NAD(+) diphosphatase [Gammaproteobacteria bacterium PRO9]|nr:NAD(+) diphosphatase [Gammaproteobacteria bacterium PRO9]